MTLYVITLSGCDDITRVPMELDDAELAVVNLLAERATKAGGGCMPTMHVTPWGDLDDYAREEITLDERAREEGGEATP